MALVAIKARAGSYLLKCVFETDDILGQLVACNR
jgi:hypothetical protein